MTASSPLKGLKIVDFSQFLAGPYATLRLADLGADVIKIERSGKGDLSRYLYVSDVLIDGESTIFHAINRGKRSLALDLKTDEGQQQVWDLIEDADVVVQNFRPGVIERLGFGPDAVRKRNPRIVYGSISGYGDNNEWVALPGQDLLAQARSGVMWLTGAEQYGPVAIGLPVADVLAGAALAQGILALLVRRGITGEGGIVETSLIEAITDLQFELLSTFLNDGRQTPTRPRNNPAHAYLAAPYGVYQTEDGYIAIAMNDLGDLFASLGVNHCLEGLNPFDNRDEIAHLLAKQLARKSTSSWIEILAEADLWAAPVMDWNGFVDSGILQKLNMIGETRRGDQTFNSLLSPLRIDGARPAAESPAPYLSEKPVSWNG
ncbi:MAG: CaiB/BaiF CoA-transferase family protein [Roseibium sp.]